MHSQTKALQEQVIVLNASSLEKYATLTLKLLQVNDIGLLSVIANTDSTATIGDAGC